jgi:hypothetical protein
LVFFHNPAGTGEFPYCQERKLSVTHTENLLRQCV